MSGRPICVGCDIVVGDFFFRPDEGPVCAACMTLAKLGMHPKLRLFLISKSAVGGVAESNAPVAPGEVRESRPAPADSGSA